MTNGTSDSYKEARETKTQIVKHSRSLEASIRWPKKISICLSSENFRCLHRQVTLPKQIALNIEKGHQKCHPTIERTKESTLGWEKTRRYKHICCHMKNACQREVSSLTILSRTTSQYFTASKLSKCVW